MYASERLRQTQSIWGFFIKASPINHQAYVLIELNILLQSKLKNAKVCAFSIVNLNAGFLLDGQISYVNVLKMEFILTFCFMKVKVDSTRILMRIVLNS